MAINYSPHRALRVLDVLIVAVSSLVWAPLLAMAAVVSRLLQGAPVLFKQHRVGLGGEEFEVLKLRTMVINADEYLDEGGRPTIDRITPFGRILRRTSLDELPQLLNVIKGDMSLVGPRPVLPMWLDKIPGGATHPRFSVRPVLTGLAQVEGRNTVMWSRRLSLDSEFANNPSLSTYIRCLVATPLALVRPTVAVDRNAATVDDLQDPGTR